MDASKVSRVVTDEIGGNWSIGADAGEQIYRKFRGRAAQAQCLLAPPIRCTLLIVTYAIRLLHNACGPVDPSGDAVFAGAGHRLPPAPVQSGRRRPRHR